MSTTKTFKYGNETIEVLNIKHSLTPTSANEITIPASDKRALSMAIQHNIPTLLIGQTGTGKSEVLKYLAYKRKQPYVRVNMNGYTTPDELIGTIGVKNNATIWNDGVITRAMKDGAILVLDEVNGTTQDCLFVLHGLLDNDKRITLPNGDVVRPHENFRVFATANPDYEGTKTMNKAFIDRFGIILNIDVLAPAQEKALLVKRTGITEDQAEQLVAMATMARKDYLENKILTYVSTRSLLTVGLLINKGMTIAEAYKSTIERKTTNKEEQRILHDFFLAVMKFADSTGDEALDKPIVTTQREIDNLKRQIEQIDTAYSDYVNKVRNDMNQARVDKDLLQEYRVKHEEVSKQYDKLQAELTEAKKEIDSFRRLQDIIKQVAPQLVEGKNTEPTKPSTGVVAIGNPEY